MSIAHVRYEPSGIAATIRQQIGTDTWLTVSARQAKYWTTDTGHVVFAFRFGNRYGLPKWCEVTYRPVTDDYALTAYKIHRNGCKRTLAVGSDAEGIGWERAEVTGVHAESLAGVVRRFNQIAELA